MTTTLAPRSRTANVVAATVLVLDLLVLAYAAIVAGWTWQELHANDDADALTALGYPIALVVAAPAVISLLLLRLARTARGRTGRVLVGAAAVPLLLLALVVVATSLG